MTAGEPRSRIVHLALLGSIADKALEVRDAQRAYFDGRLPEQLHRSKQLERELDELLEQRRRFEAGEPEPPTQGALL